MAVVTTGLQVATTMQEYKSQKAIAEGRKKANEQTRRNSDQAYLNDLTKIDAEAVSASRELRLAEFTNNREAEAAKSKALNLNGGDADKIVQDMIGTRDLQFFDVTKDYETDIFKLTTQETDAYAAQQRRYNSIAPVIMPSSTGALLKIGTQAATGYNTYQASYGTPASNTPSSPYGDRSLYKTPKPNADI
tara:strand:- start:4448 stop:5020 length:573 start_codon:yes stop_codon:yes gene_type:complete